MTICLPTFTFATPDENYGFPVKLSCVAVNPAQPNAEVRDRLPPEYAGDADAQIAISQVVDTHFAKAAAANGYWRGKS